MPTSGRSRLDIEDIGEAIVVRFVDRKILNDHNMEVIGEELFSLANTLGRRRLVLDFRNVQYLQSSVFGILITLNRKVNDAGGQLVFCNIDAEVHKVFAMTRLDKLFTIEGPGGDDSAAD